MSTFYKDYAADFKNRLLEAMGDESAHSVAKRAEISYTAFRGYLNGSTPGSDKAQKLAQALGVNVGWLVSGEGEKYSNFKEKHQTSYEEMPNEINMFRAIRPELIIKCVSALYRHIEEKKLTMDAESFGEAAAILCEMSAAAGGYNQGLIERLMRLKSRA